MLAYKFQSAYNLSAYKDKCSTYNFLSAWKFVQFFVSLLGQTVLQFVSLQVQISLHFVSLQLQALSLQGEMFSLKVPVSLQFKP